MIARELQGTGKLPYLWLAAACFVLITVSVAQAVDYYDPPWDSSLPYQTLQAWEFEAEPTLMPSLVDNEYGLPELLVETAYSWQVVDGHDGTPVNTLHVDVDGPITYPNPHVQWPNGTWYTFNGLITIPGNPPEEWITFEFAASTNIEEIVIKTICIPEPTTLALLALGGVAAIRRR